MMEEESIFTDRHGMDPHISKFQEHKEKTQQHTIMAAFQKSKDKEIKKKNQQIEKDNANLSPTYSQPNLSEDFPINLSQNIPSLHLNFKAPSPKILAPQIIQASSSNSLPFFSFKTPTMKKGYHSHSVRPSPYQVPTQPIKPMTRTSISSTKDGSNSTQKNHSEIFIPDNRTNPTTPAYQDYELMKKLDPSAFS